MNILAIDSATEVLGLCLRIESRKQTAIIQEGLTHSEILIPKIDQMIADAGSNLKSIDLIICSLGPGSFTGIRIGLAAAKGLALGIGCPLVGLSNLDGLAYRFRHYDGIVVPVLSALREKYYSALYKNGIRISDYLDLPINLLADRLKKYRRIYLTGPDSEILSDTMQDNNSIVIRDYSSPFTDPEGLLEAGIDVFKENGPAGEDISPLYLRKSEAEICRHREKNA